MEVVRRLTPVVCLSRALLISIPTRFIGPLDPPAIIWVAFCALIGLPMALAGYRLWRFTTGVGVGLAGCVACKYPFRTVSSIVASSFTLGRLSGPLRLSFVFFYQFLTYVSTLCHSSAKSALGHRVLSFDSLAPSSPVPLATAPGALLIPVFLVFVLLLSRRPSSFKFPPPLQFSLSVFGLLPRGIVPPYLHIHRMALYTFSLHFLSLYPAGGVRTDYCCHAELLSAMPTVLTSVPQSLGAFR